MTEMGFGVSVPQSLAFETYIAAPNHNYVLLNTELLEDDNLLSIEFFLSAPGQVYMDVSNSSVEHSKFVGR